MSVTRIAKAWGTGCLRQVFVSGLVLLVIVIALVGLVVLSVTLPLTTDQRSSLIFAGLFAVIALLVVGVLAWGAVTIRQQAERLDKIFNPLGLTGKRYLVNGRQYHGSLQGRQVDIYFYRGPSLVIYVAAKINTRLSIDLKGSLSRVTSQHPTQPEVVTTDPDLVNLVIFSIDAHWGRDLLADPGAKSAILRLVGLQPGAEIHNLLFQPEAIELQVHHLDPANLTIEAVTAWMNDLFSLVRISESHTPPLETAKASSLERRVRMNRGDFTLLLLGVSCGIIAAVAVVIIIVLILIDLGSSGL